MSFRIIPARPLYKRLGYWHTWHRVLMMEDGRYLEVELTPVNENWDSSWQKMLEPGSERIFWCGRSAFAHENTNHRSIPDSWVDEMRKRLGVERATWLLTGDVWSQIEPHWPAGESVESWLRARGENGGIRLDRLIGPATDEAA